MKTLRFRNTSIIFDLTKAEAKALAAVLEYGAGDSLPKESKMLEKAKIEFKYQYDSQIGGEGK